MYVIPYAFRVPLIDFGNRTLCNPCNTLQVIALHWKVRFRTKYLQIFLNFANPQASELFELLQIARNPVQRNERKIDPDRQVLFEASIRLQATP